jgi:dihydropyrimidinase
MFPKKGTIAVGSDADIVVFDPNRKETISVNNPHTHHMKVDFSTYEGFEVQGYPDTVISRGKVIVEKNEYKGKKGDGKFIKRARYNNLLRATAADLAALK